MMRALLMLSAAVLPAPALAQSMPGMPGMKMPAKPAAEAQTEAGAQSPHASRAGATGAPAQAKAKRCRGWT